MEMEMLVESPRLGVVHGVGEGEGEGEGKGRKKKRKRTRKGKARAYIMQDIWVGQVLRYRGGGEKQQQQISYTDSPTQ